MDDAKLSRAIRLHRQGALEQAVDCHRRALALTPESGGAHGILGQTLFRFGRFADAEASYRCALAVEDFSADLDAGPDALVDTAVLMVSLDLVITTDTALAHLAGALGHPTWILLKRHAEWRWLLDRADSPWYPTAHLYRQAKPDDWHGVIERAARDLVPGRNPGSTLAANRPVPPA